MKLLPYLLCFLGCWLLSSCFDVREEIWVAADGSGRAEMTYTVPATSLKLIGGESELRNQIHKLIDSEPELQLDELTITTSEGEAAITLKASTPSMLSLIEMQDNEVIRNLPKAASSFAGEFDVEWEGLAIDFDRRIDLQRALGFAALAVSSDQRRKRSLQYIIHLPNRAAVHNATRTEDEGRTLIWEFSLGDALASPLEIDFLVHIPIPWWVYLILTLIAVLIIAILVKARRRSAFRQS
ncbi:hypothetical protein ACFQY0_14815 [Haloferula chungangensis]|uniref:DUF3153 domain-containing protein n=1 Tax=Haloferula chungangensis TaxID=1048331 RepID=A0ABW2LAW7_9BACT